MPRACLAEHSTIAHHTPGTSPAVRRAVPSQISPTRCPAWPVAACSQSTGADTSPPETFPRRFRPTLWLLPRYAIRRHGAI